MFGHNVFSYDAIPNLHKAESKIFHSTNYDVEPTDGSGKYTKVKWYANVSNYHYQADNGLGWSPTKFKTTKCVIEFLKASDKNNLNRIAKTTHGIKFLSLNPDEANTTEDCGLGTEYVDGIDNPKDPSKIQDDTNGGDDSNGDSNGTPVEGCMDDTATNYDESATVDDGSCEFEDDEIDSNLITYGIIGIVGIIAISVLKK